MWQLLNCYPVIYLNWPKVRYYLQIKIENWGLFWFILEPISFLGHPSSFSFLPVATVSFCLFFILLFFLCVTYFRVSSMFCRLHSKCLHHPCVHILNSTSQQTTFYIYLRKNCIPHVGIHCHLYLSFIFIFEYVVIQYFKIFIFSNIPWFSS